MDEEQLIHKVNAQDLTAYRKDLLLSLVHHCCSRACRCGGVVSTVSRPIVPKAWDIMSSARSGCVSRAKRGSRVVLRKTKYRGLHPRDKTPIPVTEKLALLGPNIPRYADWIFFIDEEDK